jgi:hypothetical protein
METPLGPFLPTHNNHHSWHWEQTGTNTIVENTHIFNTHKQVHYKAHLTRHQIKVNQSNKLNNTQPILHSYPIMIQQSTDTTWTFAQPQTIPNEYNLHRPKQAILCNLYKTEMLKLVQYRHLSMPDTQAIAHKMIVIRIASNQWGAHANFGWCTTYQGNDHQHPLGVSHDHVQLQQQVQAALLFLQMRLTPIFQEQLHFHTVTEHRAPLNALVHSLKIETHNPRWQLNRNWDILNSIMHNIHIHQLNWYLGQDNNTTHQHVLRTANIQIMEYKVQHPTLLPWQQPTLDYRLAYLHHCSTIINEQYDKSITHAYNSPKFTKYCCAKFLWTTKTFLSVNWKAYQHPEKKLNINQRTHLLKFIYKWLPIRETLVQINSSASPKCPSCNTTTKTHNHIFRCKNTNRQQITEDCIAQIDQINHKWELPTQLTNEISMRLSFVDIRDIAGS